VGKLKKNAFSSAREASFFALKEWLKKGVFLADSFHEIRLQNKMDVIDLQLAQEIAFGVVRRFHTLDAIMKMKVKDQKIKLKPEAKLILKMAVYQLVFMDKVPVYAVVFESVEMSKKHSPYQAGFINGFLRKFTMTLPIFDLKNQLSVEEYYSLPLDFIKKIQKSYADHSDQILETTISRPKMTYLSLDLNLEKKEKEAIYEGKFHYFGMKKDTPTQKLFSQSKVYIQNPTPGILIETLAENHAVDSILDLCSAPGGKLILAHTLFPKAKLLANEYVEERIKTLKENCKKYGIEATFFNQDGRNLALSEKVDVVIIDAPCSNSGVLHKKPEAKFRLDQKSIDELKKTQLELLQGVIAILKPKGVIWYLTCSILPEENEELIQEFIKLNPEFSLSKSRLILPDGGFFDGGYGVEIRRK
jgi:16S rRNA (cytosine967-C5)-methyltransferase